METKVREVRVAKAERRRRKGGGRKEARTKISEKKRAEKAKKRKKNVGKESSKGMGVSQTSFSLYLHNQWTDFYKLSCTGKH